MLVEVFLFCTFLVRFILSSQYVVKVSKKIPYVLVRFLKFNLKFNNH